MGIKGILMGVGAIAGGVAVLLGFTNPGPEAFHRYATDQATEYLNREFCTQSLPVVGTSFQDECVRLLQTPEIKTQIRELIVQNTRRENFLVLSLYKSDLDVSRLVPFVPAQLLPTYHVETVGVLNQFQVYSAETAQ